MSSAEFTKGELARAFALAGAARLTLVSQKTGTRFTFRIVKKSDDAPHFVALLNGPNNEADYTFLGTIFAGAKFVHGKNSKVGVDAPSAKAFAWAWRHLAAGTIPPSCTVYHEGRCGHCGRALTTPHSIETGIGPVCQGKLS